MRPARIEVEIGELVLHGVPREQAAGLGESIRAQLAALASGAEAGHGPGADVARAVWDRLPTGDRTAAAPAVPGRPTTRGGTPPAPRPGNRP